MKSVFKIFGFFFLLGLLSFGIKQASSFSKQDGVQDEHRNCSCSSLTCQCDATCLDIGEIPYCECSIWECICTCDEKMAIAPTQTPRQFGNSKKLESHLRQLSYIALADGIKAQRDAMTVKDVDAYKLAAEKTKTALNALSTTERESIERWAYENLEAEK